MSDVECEECGGSVRGTQGVSAEAIGVCRQCWPDLADDRKQEILDEIERIDVEAEA